MSKPVYKVFIIENHTEAWHQLSKEEQDNLWLNMEEISKSAGVKALIGCYSRWADEGIAFWGVEEYPDMESLQKVTEEQEKLEWWRYYKAKTILGTKWEE